MNWSHIIHTIALWLWWNLSSHICRHHPVQPWPSAPSITPVVCWFLLFWFGLLLLSMVLSLLRPLHCWGCCHAVVVAKSPLLVARHCHRISWFLTPVFCLLSFQSADKIVAAAGGVVVIVVMATALLLVAAAAAKDDHRGRWRGKILVVVSASPSSPATDRVVNYDYNHDYVNEGGAGRVTMTLVCAVLASTMPIQQDLLILTDLSCCLWTGSSWT